MLSYFRRKHFKNILNTYLFFVGFCGHNQFFVRTLQNSKNSENFAFPTTLRSFEEFFQKTADVVLKRPIGYRIQSFFNCKIVREVYKKIQEHFESQKLDFSLILGCSDKLFRYKIANFLKHFACN